MPQRLRRSSIALRFCNNTGRPCHYAGFYSAPHATRYPVELKFYGSEDSVCGSITAGRVDDMQEFMINLIQEWTTNEAYKNSSETDRLLFTQEVLKAIGVQLP